MLTETYLTVCGVSIPKGDHDFWFWTCLDAGIGDGTIQSMFDFPELMDRYLNEFGDSQEI